MCMFYNKPRIKNFNKPQLMFKVMTQTGRFPYQVNSKISRGTWLQAKAPYSYDYSFSPPIRRPRRDVSDYGFHVFATYAGALSYTNSTDRIERVKVRGRVFGSGFHNSRHLGYRVEQLYLYKSKRGRYAKPPAKTKTKTK